ncbi:MAG: FtsX-like permease family protein [Planctomycetota bacterium]
MIFRLVRKNLRRRPMRTIFTILGAASALFIYVTTESLSQGLDEALASDEAARTLVVYRKNRFCPQTSFLPERYTEEISRVPGVEAVLPIKVLLNNYRASLDMVAFHGSPVESMLAVRDIELVSGDVGKFKNEADAALLGRGFAQRRGLGVGDSFEFGEIRVKVAGVFRSASPVDENLVLTHLEFLQRAGPVNQLGTVTQYEVRISDPDRAEEIAKAIDARFADAEDPTDTRSRFAFLEDMTHEIGQIMGFARIFGAVCVLVVLVLVANTVFMSANERIRELGVVMTIGYRSSQIFALVLGEALIIVAIGAALGVGGALGAIALKGVALGVEGVQIGFSTHWTVIARGFAAALVCGLVAGLIPATRAARRPVVAALRGNG